MLNVLVVVYYLIVLCFIGMSWVFGVGWFGLILGFVIGGELV